MTDADELARIELKIRSLCEAFLDTGRPYLLSKLGLDLGEDLPRLKALSGGSLANFLARRFADQYAIVLGGKFHNVQAAVRVGQENTLAISFEKGEVQEDGDKHGPRYNYRFWAAFSVPIKEGKRFLDLRDFTFRDTSDAPVGDYREIDGSLIPAEDLPNRDAQIRANIESWLTSNEFAPDRFYAQERSRETRSLNTAGGANLLEAVLGALDQRQLARTTLPLDVVADLLRKRV